MDILPVSVIIFLLIGSLILLAFFNASETALLAANKMRIKRKAKEEKNKRAIILLKLFDRPSEFLSVLIIGITLVVTISATLVNVLVQKFTDSPVIQGGAIFIWTVVILIFGEVAPKTISISYADSLALILAQLTHLFVVILSPLLKIIIKVTDILVGPFKQASTKTQLVLTAEELKGYINIGEESGIIEKDEKEMLNSIFDFGDTLIREVMVPRIDIKFVDVESSLNDVLEVIIKEGHSRIPIYKEGTDTVVGVVYAKDILKCFKEKRTEVKLTEIARKPYFVPETKKVAELFQDMRKNKIHMAIVVDEYGGTAGLVTIEDLLEEIVGEIQDEYDTEEPSLVPTGEDSYLVNGKVLIEEINDLLDVQLPLEEVDTIGGLVYSILGRIPKEDEKLTLNNVLIKIVKVEGQRITKLWLQKLPIKDEADTKQNGN